MSLNSQQHFRTDHRCNIDLQREPLQVLAWGQVVPALPGVRARGQAQEQAAEEPLPQRVAGEGENLLVAATTCLGRQDLRLFRRTYKIWPMV
jgi:hypothetical protein